MDNLSSNNVEIALTEYRLLNCKAESKIKASPNSGGSLEITSGVGTPTSPPILKKNSLFVIKISVEIIGKPKDSKDIAFSASCNFEGKYRITNCEKSGVSTKDNLKLWALAINQLHPLVSQFVSDIVSKMGFKNVNVPPLLPGQYASMKSPQSSPKKIKAKSENVIPAKVK
jgi:preprotein translocase subunit SecB